MKFFFGLPTRRGASCKENFIKVQPIIVFTLIALFFIGTACNRASENASGSGFGITQGDEFRRIISASPANTEIITALNMGDFLIAIDRHSRGIDAVPAGLPEVDFFYPDTEAIIGLEPDLILVGEVNTFGVANNPFTLLGDLGIKVVQVPTSVSIEGIYSDIILIAEALGVKERGETLVESMKGEIERIADGVNPELEKRSIYFEISNAPNMVSFGQGAYLNEMIEIAGGRNIFADQRGWFSPSAEEIINRNPDIILVLVYPGEDPVTEIKNRRAFESIAALRENHVFAIDADSASRPSQNILLAFRQIERAINTVVEPSP